MSTSNSDAILWSALSIIFLLVATALVLFLFGRFDYLVNFQQIINSL